jgi:L-2-hydroxyglutarate oxidase LhgO
MDSVDTIVVGAGVVGLAVAKVLAETGQEVMVLEGDTTFGTGTSSRNSEVIHAGIYYPAGSQKAKFCVDGKHRLYAYLRERGLPFDNCGKLIVATSQEQLGKLVEIKAKAEANGVMDIEWCSPEQVSELEPNVVCTGALFSPSTGIIDSHSFMQSLLGDLENNGGALVANTRFESAEVADGGFVVHTTSGGEAFSFRCRKLVNSAGLHAGEVAAAIRGLDPAHVPAIHFAKGNYFTITDRPFSRLIYPVPEPGGLGVHVTLDLGRCVKFGPDVEWIDAITYDVDLGRSCGFYEAIRRYYPALRDGALTAGYAGIRPKLSSRGQADSDFLISTSATHGIPGLVNLFAIESPGLTSSLAIAEHVHAHMAASA